jgi:hypothetical protein
MNNFLKDKLINFNKLKGWDITDVDLMETITEATILWEGKRNEHRWYCLIPTVIRIGDTYLQYNRCEVRSEESNIADCIGGYKLEDVIEVVPVDKVITVYEEK